MCDLNDTTKSNQYVNVEVTSSSGLSIPQLQFFMDILFIFLLCRLNDSYTSIYGENSQVIMKKVKAPGISESYLTDNFP